MNRFHHNDLKSELIECGLEAVNTDGIKNLSLRKLASKCNVSEAAPYSHFKNKDDLIKEMQNFVSEKLYESLYEAANSCKNKNSAERIYKIGEAYVLFAIEKPEYFNFIFSFPSASIDLSMTSDDDFKPFKFFKEESYRVYRKKDIDDEDIKYGIISMWSRVHGIATIASMPNIKTDFEWKDVLRRIILDN